MKYITYILGNGFDLACGMNTRFCDMYQEYVKEPSQNEIIKAFKRDIENDKAMHYQNWSDFELGMAKYATKLESERTLKICLADFKKFMVEYLKRECKRFADYLSNQEIKDRVLSQISKELFNYDASDLPPNERRRIGKIMNELTAANVISFNYTDTLNTLFEKGKRFDKVYQVHGTLHSEVIMGVDNQEQIQNLPYDLTKSGKRAFIKPLINTEFNQERVDKIANTLLMSDLIIIFGWSLGDSDLSWKKLLKSWLLSSERNELVYFKKDTNQTTIYEAGDLLDEIDAEREEFMERLGLSAEEKETLKERIHIPINNRKFQITIPDTEEEIEWRVG